MIFESVSEIGSIWEVSTSVIGVFGLFMELLPGRSQDMGDRVAGESPALEVGEELRLEIAPSMSVEAAEGTLKEMTS